MKNSLILCELFKKYFGKLTIIPKTEVFKERNGDYVVKQENISGEKLSKKILEDNPKLVSKFARLVIANELMWQREGVFLDLLGSDILAQPHIIHNLLTDGENIYIFDFGLLENNSKNIVFRYISRFTQKFQLFFIKQFF